MKKFLLSLLVFLFLTPAALAQQRSLTSATCPGTGCTVYQVSGQGSISLQLSGTFSATVQFEQTNNPDVGWVALQLSPVTGGAAVTSSTTTGIWAGGISGAKFVRLRVSAYTSGTVVIDPGLAQARNAAPTGGNGTLSTLALGAGAPTATKPFDATFSTNTNQQFLWFNNNAGASAGAEGCFKTDTVVGCLSAQGVSASVEPQRTTLYTNVGVGGTSGNPGWDIVSCYSATPTLCNTRFFTNTTDGIAGERMRIDSTGLKFPATHGISQYQGITTAGSGVPFITSNGRGVGISSSLDTNRCTFTPAADGSFLITDYILVTAAGAATNMNGTITFKTEEGTSRSVLIVWQIASGGTLTNVQTAGGTVGYYGVPIRIRAQASTAITVSTTGTPSTAVYNHECSITQIS